MENKHIPAFPTVMLGEIEGGMTLRDYFAAQAVQGLITTQSAGSKERYAEIAYALADAMLIERQK